MDLLHSVRAFLTVPVALLTICLGSARADVVDVSSFPGGIVTGTVNAELNVDMECIIAPGAFIKGDIKQSDPSAAWNITVMPGAQINGNIEDLGQGSVLMAIAPGRFFNGNIKEAGKGDVAVLVEGLYNGNLEESNSGHVLIYVVGSGLFNGNAYEKNAGDLISFGNGKYNGSTKEEGLGMCYNFILKFEGSPCE